MQQQKMNDLGTGGWIWTPTTAIFSSLFQNISNPQRYRVNGQYFFLYFKISRVSRDIDGTVCGRVFGGAGNTRNPETISFRVHAPTGDHAPVNRNRNRAGRRFRSRWNRFHTNTSLVRGASERGLFCPVVTTVWWYVITDRSVFPLSVEVTFHFISLNIN